MLAFVFIVGAKMSQARPSSMPVPVRPHPIAIEAIDEGSEVDLIVEETTEVTTGGSGSSLITILAGQCKTVEYTEWSACNKNFGSKGIQFRDIVRPTLGNCLPTGIQQAETVRDCQ